MRLPSLRLILSGCAALALALPAAAQEAPVVVDPPLPGPTESAPVSDPAADVAPSEPEVPAIPAVWAPPPIAADGQSAYGLYLSGRLASLRGDQDAGAALLVRSHNLTPEQPQLGNEAFFASLLSGDIDAVVRLTPYVAETPLLADAGRLMTVVQGLRDGDGRAALADLTVKPLAEPFSQVGRYLLPSVSAAAGDWDTALRPVDASEPGVLALRDQRAQLLEARRRFGDAETEYKTLLALPDGPRLYQIHYAAFLERRGRREEALAAYAQVLSSATPDPRALGAVQRVQAGGRAPAASEPSQIAGDALAFAALEASQAGAHDFSAIYLRLAEVLKPSDEVALRLGQSLAAYGQRDAAREAFARVSAENPIVYASAQIGLGSNFSLDDRDEEALEAFRRADAAAPEQAVVARMLAAQYFDLGRYDEALAVLNRPAVNTARQSLDVRFLRGATLERMGRIDEAEAELWTALQMAPNDPAMLNHLGYMWVDSGRRVDQGAEMIARAYAADPRNANIQDSLGWAQYRRGQYEVAVQTLEEAVAKQPANPEINDHLGDAYWQVGRHREASWQWNRVLTLDPDAETRAEVEQKLAVGLTAAPVTGSQP